MAPTAEMECLHCGKSDNNTEFHDIFDDVGVELNLDNLLEQFFQLKVTPDPSKKQVLCESCINDLIELFDISERIKENNCNNEDSGSHETNEKDGEQAEDSISRIQYDNTVSSSNSSEKDSNHENDTLIEELEDDFDRDFEYIEINDEGSEADVENDRNDSEENVNYLNVPDDIDLETYADATINSNLEELQLEHPSQCNICSTNLTNHQDLLNHIKLQHVNEAGYPCVIENCRESFENDKRLARHIVLKHYDLRNISIIGACYACGISFTNFIDFNKHSCCRKYKCRGRNLNFCTDCNMEFPTFRKFRFHMQFHMPKRRPKVCLLCDQFFTDGDEFFNHVHYDHEPDDLYSCIKCDRTFKDKELYDAHTATHDSIKKYKCPICPKAFAYKHGLKNHMESHHTGEDTFKCEFCNKILSSKINFRNHMKFHEPDAEVQVYLCSTCGLIGRESADLQAHVEDGGSKCFEATINQEIISTAYVCEYCDSMFKSRDDLKEHRETGIHNDKIFHCPFCESSFNELRKIRSHVKAHKTFENWRKSLPLNRLYMCDVGDCQHAYAMWISLHNHKLMKHKDLKLICSKCNQKFHTHEEFDTHTEKCQNDGKYTCQFCSKQCRSKMSLSVHIARSHNNKNVSCPTCKACFKDETTLQNHIDLLHIEMACSYCQKVVKNKRNLILHERVKHANEKRYFCDTCEKGFYNRSDMETHKKTSHSAISYQCELCNFSTNYKNTMDVHIAKHNKDFQFKCPLCSREFTRKSVLNIHIKRHQVNREFVCSEHLVDGCGASFITRYLLNKHIKEKHAKPSTDGMDPPAKRKRKRSIKTDENADVFVDADDPDSYIYYEKDDDHSDFNIVDNVCRDSNDPQSFLLEYTENSAIEHDIVQI